MNTQEANKRMTKAARTGTGFENDVHFQYANFFRFIVFTAYP
jgi:hypothetical protein